MLSHKGMEDHGSDADDEITDVSGEYLGGSSSELCVTRKEYFISSGTKPLSLVIRRYDTSTTSVGCIQSSTEIESSCPVIPSEYEQIVSEDNDILLQKHVQCLFENKKELTTQSGICLSPENPVSSTEMNEVKSNSTILKDQQVSIDAVNVIQSEVTINSVCSSVLMGESAENTLASADTDYNGGDLFKTSRTGVSQPSAQLHNNSVLVDSLDCSYNDVSSDAVYVEHSPLLFSSDDENSYYTGAVNNEQETAASTSNYNAIIMTEQKKLHRLQEALLGVPPPPSITIPQLQVTDILRLLNENKGLMISADAESEYGAKVAKSQEGPLDPYIEQVKNSSWPESKSCCYYGIQYNHGHISEEFEMLCQKLQERYVGCETTSSCSIWFNRDISNKVRNMTNRRRSTGQSPGRRLSHLARRRQTFSSANLLNNSVAGQIAGNRHSTAVKRRLIMVEIKKNEHRQRSKSYQPHKQGPRTDCSRLQQTKRALFISPPKRIPSASKSRSGSKKIKRDIDRNRVQNSKRALWPSTSKDNATAKAGHDRVLTNLSGQINVYGKRKREETCTPAQQNKCPRRMLFDNTAPTAKGRSECSNEDFTTAGDKNQGVRTSENKPQVLSQAHSVSRDLIGGLSELHRKKLLWAVAEALRAEGINMSHPLFRPHATSLARLVRNVMPDLKCSKREGSTSDLMLQLAKEHVKDVTKKQQNGETKGIK